MYVFHYFFFFPLLRHPPAEQQTEISQHKWIHCIDLNLIYGRNWREVYRQGGKESRHKLNFLGTLISAINRVGAASGDALDFISRALYSNLDCDSGYPHWGSFCGLLISFQVNSRTVAGIDHDQFIIDPFPCINATRLVAGIVEL
jgi:hypothetical protein